MSSRHLRRAASSLALALIVLSGCQAARNEGDDVARYAAQLVEKWGWRASSKAAVEDWLRATRSRTGLTLDGIIGKVDDLRPTVIALPPIRSSARTFARDHRVPETMRSHVEDAFIGTMCDAASLIAQRKPVDADEVVESAIKNSVGTLGEVLELIILREELTSKVREFARAKTASDQAGVTTDISFTLECFVLGKVTR